MVTIPRILALNLPRRQSAFLWGPRKTGKSTYLAATFPNSLVFDFLKTDLFLDFAKRPALLREQLLAKDKGVLKNPIILDEVQNFGWPCASEPESHTGGRYPRTDNVLWNNGKS